MARLYRPTIPLEIKCRVALRQLGEFNPDAVVGARCRSLGRLLEETLERVAAMKACRVEDLRLDHDPPLAARAKSYGMLGSKPQYIPDANDPDHLFYRPHGAEFAGSHLIKTNVRGDNGQHPDRVLIKKMRRLERGPRPKRQPGFKKNPAAPKREWPSRPFPSSKGRK